MKYLGIGLSKGINFFILNLMQILR
ncbi:hypothetical protein [Staphylococcus sp. HMSC62A08]